MLKIHLFLSIVIGFIVTLFILFYTTDVLTIHPFINISKQSNHFYASEKDINENFLDADNIQVIHILKQKFLFPPSSKPYILNEPDLNPSMGQAQRIDQILNGMKNGFFIECGALDGETRSNTLYFERERGWRGLLIEADPKNFELIVTKNRKAYSSPTCLAPSSHPLAVKFQQQQNMGHIVGELFHISGGPQLGAVLEVQCFPLISYIKALNISSVDYFSLDVEGAEFDILQSIPWKEVDIKTLSVEFIHNKADKMTIRDFMRDQGYFVHSEVTDPHWLANDFIFVREDLFSVK